MPGSRIYTKGDVLVYILEPFTPVSDARKAFSELSELGRENPGGGLFDANSAGQLNNHRCPEAFGLYGRLDAERLMKALAETPDLP